MAVVLRVWGTARARRPVPKPQPLSPHVNNINQRFPHRPPPHSLVTLAHVAAPAGRGKEYIMQYNINTYTT